MLGFFILFCSGLGILSVFHRVRSVLAACPGNTAMVWVSDAIEEGASAYLTRHYQTIAAIGIVLAGFFWFFLGVHGVSGFVLGAVLSGVAGYMGMWVSIRCNGRTAEAARPGCHPALRLAFQGGSVAGLLAISLGLLGVGGYYLYFGGLALTERALLDGLLSFGFGASLMSLSTRLGGGIFAKGADIGVGLAQKTDTEITEDDPRNPAVIADNVGDNVGDCLSAGADLFDSYVMAMIATMVLGALCTRGDLSTLFMIYPVAIGAVSIIGFMVGTFFVRLVGDEALISPLYRGFFVGAFVSFLGMVGVTLFLLGFDTYFDLDGFIVTGGRLIVCALIGIVLSVGVFYATNYYTHTGRNPVRRIAGACVFGDGGSVIEGLAVSMESCVVPVLLMGGGILGAYVSGGTYGIGIAALSMVSLSGMALSLNVCGPIIDNAGGIARMAGLPDDVRFVTHALDGAFNTAKTGVKGYAALSAGLTALALYSIYVHDLNHYFPTLMGMLSLSDPYVMAGLLTGGVCVYGFGSMVMAAVSHTGEETMEIVRRQWREKPGIITGEDRPCYGKTTDLLAKNAFLHGILPGCVAVLGLPVMGCLIALTSGYRAAFTALGGALMGVIVTGLPMAISMALGGGAWDNAKKYIEEGNHGGYGSDAHRAAITGDRVGDPYKDATGPAINSMIKIIHIIALLTLGILAGAH